jgi:hypothetical protein
MTNEELSNDKNFKIFSQVIGKKYPWIIGVYPDPYNDGENHSKTDVKWKNYFLIFVIDGDKFMSEYNVKLGNLAQEVYDETNIIKDTHKLEGLFDNEEDKEIVKNVEDNLDNVMKGFKKSEIIPKSLRLDSEGRYLIGGFDIEKK